MFLFCFLFLKFVCHLTVHAARQEMSDLVYGGIEGGGTHSHVILINGVGNILCQEEYDFSTSHWLVGMDECFKRLADMVQQAKKKAGLNADVPLKGLGLSLSGCEQDETNLQLKNGLRNKYPNLSEEYVVVSDTVGSVVTVNPTGGIVLISGTGSNSLLLNPDGSTHRCGGWGYLLGDEGSAYWLALRAVKMIIDESEDFCELPYSSSKLKPIIFGHFKIKDKFGLLEHAYSKFDKAFFADLARKIAEGAVIRKDPLCAELFREAGEYLGRHLAALAPKINKSLLNEVGGLHVVCVGQMWNSWELLKPGFMKALSSKRIDEYFLPEFTLLNLQTSLALGAAYLGAKKAGVLLPINFNDNATPFFHWKNDKVINGTVANMKKLFMN